MTDMIRHSGGCHCGKVRFEVQAPAHIEVSECNCSICSKAGYLHLIVPKSRFRLLCGEDSLTTYQFNTRTAQHTFCRHCGIHPFYVPRSDPDKIDVNVRCLDGVDLSTLQVTRFDGKNWEQAMRQRDA